jgi:hypothetical protein
MMPEYPTNRTIELAGCWPIVQMHIVFGFIFLMTVASVIHLQFADSLPTQLSASTRFTGDNMSLRTKRRIEYLLALVLTCVAICILYFASFPPADITSEIAQIERKKETESSNQASADSVEMEDFKPLWNLKLQQSLDPLVEMKTEIAAQKPIQVPPPKPAAPNVELLNIFYSDDAKMAVFRLPGSKAIIRCFEGDSIANATVTSIKPTQVELGIDDFRYEYNTK